MVRKEYIQYQFNASYAMFDLAGYVDAINQLQHFGQPVQSGGLSTDSRSSKSRKADQDQEQE